MRFVLTADWHLREDVPRCRKDEDWMGTQRKALRQIADICNQKGCDLFVVGDMFHRPREYRMVSLVQTLAASLTRRLFYLMGNHDLKYHSSKNEGDSCIGLLRHTTNCHRLGDINVEGISAPDFDGEVDEEAKYMFIHTLCFPDMKSMPPNVDAVCAKDLLEEHPMAQWIFTGDYHRNFHYEWNGRHVVNSGCLLRQASDMKDYECGVYYIDTDKDIVEFIRIMDSEELVDDSYITKEKERDERMEEFVSKLGETKGLTLDFLDNVEKAVASNDMDSAVKDMIMELVG